jgi:hypothetical protein
VGTTIKQVLKGHTCVEIGANEIPQLLVQAALAYEKNLPLTIYNTFSLRMDGPLLQLIAAAIPRTYVEEIFQGKPLSHGLEILCSSRYDLREPHERREALRLLIGFLRRLDA